MKTKVKQKSNRVCAERSGSFLLIDSCDPDGLLGGGDICIRPWKVIETLVIIEVGEGSSRQREQRGKD